MSKVKATLEKFILKFGNMKSKDKAFLKSIATLIGMAVSIFISVKDLAINNYLGFSMYLLVFIGMFLMFLSFSSQYRMFKFLSSFGGNVNDKKD
jgi:hypothetical protein